MLTRRDFFKNLGCGITVLLIFREGPGQESGRGTGASQTLPQEIGGWLHIAEDGQVTVYTGKVEVGQNIRTSLTQVVAEELRLPLDSIRLLMGDTDLTPFDRGTFGSRTTPDMAPRLRKAAACAREALIGLAAQQWNVQRHSIRVEDGKLIHEGSRRSAQFGELTRGHRLMNAVTDDAPVTAPGDWKIAGRSIPKVDGHLFVSGKHKYVSDLKLPGMLYGKILRADAFGSPLISADTRKAEAMKDVVVVREGDFVGIAAPSQDAADRALAGIRAEWGASAHPSSRRIFQYLRDHTTEAQDRRRSPAYLSGSVQKGLEAADHLLKETYTVAYIAHAPLEPRAAVARWEGEKLTVWTGTQRPFGVRTELAEAFRIPEEKVRVIVPDTGSGYGGKHTGEAAIEAARLARAAGKPVKLVWTREEEFTWAYFRPAGLIEVSSGVRNDGTLTAWEFHNYNSGGAGIRTLYEVPNQKIQFHPADSPLRQGSYRALAATANHFGRETHMDELAHLLEMDPLEFRVRNLRDSRLRAVLAAAAEAFGWPMRRPSPEVGYGLACGFEKGGYVATCAQVSIEERTGAVKVQHVVAAFECGAILNPDNLKNQVAGAMVQGLGGALFEAVEFEKGRILNPRFSRYRVPRFSDTPRMETILIDRKDIPSSGAGETPIVGIAPAVGNAIFSATGIRLRSLPLVPRGGVG